MTEANATDGSDDPTSMNHLKVISKMEHKALVVKNFQQKRKQHKSNQQQQIEKESTQYDCNCDVYQKFIEIDKNRII